MGVSVERLTVSPGLGLAVLIKCDVSGWNDDWSVGHLWFLLPSASSRWTNVDGGFVGRGLWQLYLFLLPRAGSGAGAVVAANFADFLGRGVSGMANSKPI